MKRGISIHADHDREGERFLVVAKKKGKLTFDEIKDGMRILSQKTAYILTLKYLPQKCST